MGNLVDTDYVMTRMGLNPELDGLSDTIDVAISAAQVRLQTQLDTNLSSGSKEDIFFLDPEVYCGIQIDGYFRCKLSNGFVKGTPFQVYRGSRPSDVTESVSDDFVLSKKIGILYVKNNQRGKYIRITYDYGFDNGTPVIDEVKEAIVVLVPVFLNATQPTTSGQKSKDSFRVAGDSMEGISARLNRNIGFCIEPVFK